MGILSPAKRGVTVGNLIAYTVVAAGATWGGIALWGKFADYFAENKINGEIQAYENVQTWPTCILETEGLTARQALEKQGYPLDTFSALYDLGQLNTIALGVEKEQIGLKQLLLQNDLAQIEARLPKNLEKHVDMLRIRGVADVGGVQCGARTLSNGTK